MRWHQDHPREAYAKGLGLAVTALASLPGEGMIVQTSEKFVPVSALRVTLAGPFSNSSSPAWQSIRRRTQQRCRRPLDGV